MQSNQELTSNWRGSLATAGMIRTEIATRWGQEEAEKYDPTYNCFTFQGWKQRGYMVKSGEHGMKSITFISHEVEEVDEKTGEKKIKVYRSIRPVTLFYQTQVVKN